LCILARIGVQSSQPDSAFAASLFGNDLHQPFQRIDDEVNTSVGAGIFGQCFTL
jgi:hypothetical protein